MNTDYSALEQLHAQWSILDKAGKIVFLRNQWNNLINLASQINVYLKIKGNISLEDRLQAQRLAEMIKSVEEEGIKTQRELSNECFKEIMKYLLDKEMKNRDLR